MIAAIHQPQFLPWLGYLHKVACCDVFVFLDNVQFKKNEFQNRNKLLVSGEPRWVTVPVSFRFGDTLRQTRVPAEAAWRDTMWKTIEYNYSRAPRFAERAAGLRAILDKPWSCLADLNEATVRWLLDAFGIATPLRVASQLPDAPQEPTQRLIALCRLLGADTYLSGAGGHGYLDAAAFEAAGLRLAFQDYRHPVYEQRAARRNAPAFVSHLSALDGLFNCGGGAAGRRALGLDPHPAGA